MSDTVYGRYFGSETTAEKGEDNLWTVVVSMKEKIKTSKESEWEEKEISCKAIDESFEKAYDLAMTNVMEQLKEIIETNGGQSSMLGDIVEDVVE